MKKINLTILSLLLCVISSLAYANSDENNENDYTQSTEEQQSYPVSPENNISLKHDEQIPVRFFVGLNIPVIKHQRVSVTGKYQNAYFTGISSTEKNKTTYINYDLFANTKLDFGLSIDNDFDIHVLFSHNNEQNKTADTNIELSQTNFALVLDIPFTQKKQPTHPFVRLGFEHGNIDSDTSGIKADAMGFLVGMGINHNFTHNIFGTIVGMYEFSNPNQDLKNVPNIDISSKVNIFGITIGLGYRF